MESLGRRMPAPSCAPPALAQHHATASPVVFYEHAITITLSNPSCTTVSVYVTTSEGTAKSPEDYVPLSTRLYFAPGETVKQVVVSGVDDTVQEGLKWFNINLSTPTGATIVTPTGFLYVDGVEAQ